MSNQSDNVIPVQSRNVIPPRFFCHTMRKVDKLSLFSQYGNIYYYVRERNAAPPHY